MTFGVLHNDIYSLDLMHLVHHSRNDNLIHLEVTIKRSRRLLGKKCTYCYRSTERIMASRVMKTQRTIHFLPLAFFVAFLVPCRAVFPRFLKFALFRL